MDERDETGGNQAAYTSVSGSGAGAVRVRAIGRPLWLARVCLLIVLIALPFSLRHYSLTTHLAVAITVIASFLSVCFSIAAIRRRSHLSSSGRPVPSKGTLWRTLGLAMLFLGASMVGTVFHLGQFRDISKAAVTMANLRGIGQALDIYRQRTGAAAESLDRLIADVQLSPKQLVSYGDKHRPRTGNGESCYSSFVYAKCPARLSGNSRVVVAYELECWTLIKTGLFSKYGRCVLFADGHVERLLDDDFADAMKVDAKIRGRDSSAVGDTASEASEAER